MTAVRFTGAVLLGIWLLAKEWAAYAGWTVLEWLANERSGKWRGERPL